MHTFRGANYKGILYIEGVDTDGVDTRGLRQGSTFNLKRNSCTYSSQSSARAMYTFDTSKNRNSSNKLSSVVAEMEDLPRSWNRLL